jgi:hypothetical protein
MQCEDRFERKAHQPAHHKPVFLHTAHCLIVIHWTIASLDEVTSYPPFANNTRTAAVVTGKSLTTIEGLCSFSTFQPVTCRVEKQWQKGMPSQVNSCPLEAPQNQCMQYAEKPEQMHGQKRKSTNYRNLAEPMHTSTE